MPLRYVVQDLYGTYTNEETCPRSSRFYERDPTGQEYIRPGRSRSRAVLIVGIHHTDHTDHTHHTDYLLEVWNEYIPSASHVNHKWEFHHAWYTL